jgi:hypothetical protein
MFQVLDHSAVVYIGELSQATQYVIEHYGKKLDEAIRSGIRIDYADPHRRVSVSAVGEAVLASPVAMTSHRAGAD